ncbi:WAP four-disulfide core domain protein 18-like [Ylistrum balloti]|uniref:WAP four-disulfide core domain protein 18-like n=1 Tax=Ylistrum balloti TaxID=509963 RepID=UPI0029059F8B|nr:WAP four-disulfide core domain protein 18-like [Ylistrum balloti]
MFSRLCVFLIVGGLFTFTQAQFPWDTCPDNSGIVTACVVTSQNCFSDYNCPWGMKCCSYGCGRTCQRPVRCRVSPFGSKRLCFHNGMCDRSREEYCCNFRCQEPFATIG